MACPTRPKAELQPMVSDSSAHERARQMPAHRSFLAYCTPSLALGLVDLDITAQRATEVGMIML